MQYLPLGSVVSLKNNEDGQKMLITGRAPILELNNEVGYFDYGGCPFPQGNSDVGYYFNDEDIKEVNFYGLVDENENQIQLNIENGKKYFQGKHFKIEELEGAREHE